MLSLKELILLNVKEECQFKCLYFALALQCDASILESFFLHTPIHSREEGLAWDQRIFQSQLSTLLSAKMNELIADYPDDKLPELLRVDNNAVLFYHYVVPEFNITFEFIGACPSLHLSLETEKS